MCRTALIILFSLSFNYIVGKEHEFVLPFKNECLRSSRREPLRAGRVVWRMRGGGLRVVRRLPLRAAVLRQAHAPGITHACRSFRTNAVSAIDGAYALLTVAQQMALSIDECSTNDESPREACGRYHSCAACHAHQHHHTMHVSITILNKRNINKTYMCSCTDRTEFSSLYRVMKNPVKGRVIGITTQ